MFSANNYKNGTLIAKIQETHNSLVKLLNLYPDRAWSWYWLSKNPSMTLSFIKTNEKYTWDLRGLSANPNMTIQFVRDHPGYPWDWEELSKNISVATDENVRSFPNSPEGSVPSGNLPWNWERLSFHCKWETIQILPDKPWNWWVISANPNITWDIVQLYPEKDWDYYSLSKNPNITWEIVQANPTCAWHFGSLLKRLEGEFCGMVYHDPETECACEHVTWEIIQKSPSLERNWNGISLNPNITWEIIGKNLHLPWNWAILSHRTDLTWKIVKENIDKPWDWLNLSINNFLSDSVTFHKLISDRKKLRKFLVNFD